MVGPRPPLVKGKKVNDALTVLINGKSFDGFESVSVTEGIESIANSFSIQLFDKFEALKSNWPIRPGVKCQIFIGSDEVINGYIEKLDIDYTDERRGFTISGRSRPGDLVDCTHEGPTEYNNILLDKLAEKLVAPFSIKVFTSVVPKLIKKFAVKPGETIFEALDRAARIQGFFWISTRGGNIRLTRAARARASSTLEQSINILTATASYDNTKRHNVYNVKGQTAGLPDFFGLQSSAPTGSASDNGVNRYRPLTVIAENSVDSGSAKTRAEWEASNRLAQATKVNVTVQGWRQKDGTIWGANQIIPIKSQFLGINTEMLIASLSRDDSAKNGKTTSLVLVDKQSFDLKPVVNEKQSENIFNNLGADF